MPIHIGQSAKNQAEIIHNGKHMQKVYCGNKLVWQKFAKVEYSVLYNGYTPGDVRGFAPIGWHILTLTELNALIASVGGIGVLSAKLREAGAIHWRNPSPATNDYNFSARGAGHRIHNTGLYDGFGTYYSMGTSTIPYGVESLEVRFNNTATQFQCFKNEGISYRFVKDDSNNPGYVVDNSGYKYPTIKIGNLVLTACDVRTEHFRNGDQIPIVTDNTAWTLLTSPGRCYPNGNPLNV